MIITQLSASNVLKYARLELNHLPAKGLIAISGPNESGKTAVVETVCFALFGRTFSQNEEELTRIIRWGEEECRVELEFEAGDGARYRVRRTLDRDGVHAAELYRGDGKEPVATGPGTVRDAIVSTCGFDYQQYLDALYLAQMEISAPHPQSETLREIAGTRELEAVAETLEREIRQREEAIADTEGQIAEIQRQIQALQADETALARLDSQEQTLRGALEKRRTELDALRGLSEELRGLGTTLRNEIGELTALDTDSPVAWWRTQVEALDTAAGRIAEACRRIEADDRLCTGRLLEERLAGLKRHLAAVDDLLQRIDAYRSRLELAAGRGGEDGAAAEGDGVPIPQRIARLRRGLVGPRLLYGLLNLVFLAAVVAALGLGALWWLAQPETAGTLGDAVFRRITGLWPDWSDAHRGWLPTATAVAAAVALLSWIWSLAVERGIGRRRDRIRRLEAELAALGQRIDRLTGLQEQPPTGIVATLRALDDPELEPILAEFEQGAASVFLDSGALQEELAHWKRLEGELEAALADLREAVAARIGSLEQAIEAGRTALERVESERSALAERRAQADQLRNRARELEPRLAEHRRAIQVRELALQLTRGTCRSIYQRLNNVLSKFTGEVLPRFTGGHYRQLQISEDLRLRVFVTEKNDFAELEELSSGTQRQILLALRLALAKALVDAGGQSRQFIVLDEPFAFFDRERIHLTLRALPELDRRISQIWIISQEFADYDRFKLNIRCSRDSDELVVGEKGGGGLFSFAGRGESP